MRLSLLLPLVMAAHKCYTQHQLRRPPEQLYGVQELGGVSNKKTASTAAFL